MSAARRLALSAGACLVLGTAGLSTSAAASATTSTTTTTTTTLPQSSGSSGASSAAVSQLGGYETSATGSGLTWSYEQPNFPVPATPTLQLNLGYSTATYDAGPTGESLASTLWPGQLVANAGGQLPTLLQPYLGSSTPNLDVPPWPVQAASAYPPGPTTPSTSSQDSPGVTMEASSTQDAGSAVADFGSASTDGNSYALPSGFVSVQSLASAVQSTVSNGDAVAQATSQVHGISIAGGLITIGQVTSTATSTSDGNQAAVSGTSTVSDVSVAGEAVTLDSSGISLAGNGVPVLSDLLPDVQKLLQSAGISLTLTNPTDDVDGSSGVRQLDGVNLTIDLTTLDEDVDNLVAGLPQELQQKVVDQLPLPPPDSQVLDVDFGWVDVSAAASPAYDSVGSSGTASGGGTPGSGATTGASPQLPSGDAGTGFPGSTGSLVPISSPAGSNGSGSPSDGFAPATAAAAAPAKLFRGIGAGLVALGVMLALLLAWVLARADRAVGALGTGAACVGEGPVELWR